MAKAALAQEKLFALRQAIARLEGDQVPALSAMARDPGRGGFKAFPGKTQRVLPSDDQTANTAQEGLLPLDRGALDEALGGGLRLDALHEIRSSQTRDNGAVSGFVLGLCRMAQDRMGRISAFHPRILWIGDPMGGRETGLVHARGLAGFGLDPQSLVHAAPRKLDEALMIAEAALAVASFAAIILEIHGNPARFGLTESRRLHLRARAFRRPVFVLRERGEEEASSALVRLGIEPAPSAPRHLPDGRIFAGCIGRPAFRIRIEKNRIPSSSEFLLEWNPHDHVFSTARHTFDAAGDAAGSRRQPAHPVDPLPASADRPDRAGEMGRVMAFPRAS